MIASLLTERFLISGCEGMANFMAITPTKYDTYLVCYGKYAIFMKHNFLI